MDLPADIADVAATLLEQRAAASPLELDRIKLRARSQAERRSAGFGPIRPTSRTATAALTVLLVGGTAAGGIAASSGDSNGGNSAQTQYRAGKGCGDRHHLHDTTGCPPTAGRKKPR